MKSVSIQNVVKDYKIAKALDGVTLKIEAGELFFLLGPSGCGKTTLLRSLAGFVELDGGSIFIGDVDVTHLAPQKRNTGMVFQSYALWPHLTIIENVAFGLKLQKLGAKEIRTRSEEALEQVQMLSHATKKPNQLSGGQQQRVALARALVIRPSCLLLDEPLSNLDAKLRAEMRTEIRRICKQNGLTGVYVTHDQKEALSVADRIAVMRSGKIVQIGTPIDLYYRPASRFVADFIGQANFLHATARVDWAGGAIFESSLGPIQAAHIPDFARIEGTEVTLAIRPEAIRRGKYEHNPDINTFRAAIASLTYLGETLQYRLNIEDAEHHFMEIMELSRSPNLLHENDVVSWWIDPEHIIVLPRD